MLEKSENIIGWAIGSIVLGICVAIGGWFYYQNQKIIKTYGVMDNSKYMTSHNFYANEPEFDTNSVSVKIENGICVEVPSIEVAEVREDLLKNKKILDAVVGMTYAYTEPHWLWYVNKNLVKDKGEPNFTTLYFSSDKICRSYVEKKDKFIESYKEAKQEQKDRFGK